MLPVVIIGYGNVLRGDDGIGPLAARSLAVRLADQPVTVLEAHQLLPEMAWFVSQAELVVLIDAATGAAAGEIRRQRLEYAAEQRSMALGVVGHHLTGQQLLAGCRTLYGASPEVFLITVTVESFEVGEGLSEAAQEALPCLVEQVEQIVRQYLSRRPAEFTNCGGATSALSALCQPDS